MAGPSPLRSRMTLIVFLAVAILPPVIAVLGPFRDRFFTRRIGELQRLARVEAPSLDRAAVAAWLGPKLSGEGLADALAADFAAARYDAAMAALERVPPADAIAGVRWLHGIAALLANRPALALPGLEDAARAEDPELAARATFALAQAHLLLGRDDAARSELRSIASGHGAWSEEAAQQLRDLDLLK